MKIERQQEQYINEYLSLKNPFPFHLFIIGIILSMMGSVRVEILLLVVAVKRKRNALTDISFLYHVNIQHSILAISF